MRIEELIAESNRIEGILRPPTDEELIEFIRFQALDKITVEELIQFVSVYEPEAYLRVHKGDDVSVGGYRAPPGGPKIREILQSLLDWPSLVKAETQLKAYQGHQAYEHLHPFIDCNGRSGRMLWYWMMKKEPIAQRLGFLHIWYYQSLENRGG